MLNPFIFLCLLLFSFSAFSQNKKDKELIDKVKEIDNKQYLSENGVEGFSGNLQDSLKHAGKDILVDSLNIKQNLVNIPIPNIDSLTKKEVKQQIKAVALDSLNNQNLLKENDYLQEILNISIDSTTSKRVKQQLKSVVTDSLNNQKFQKENEYLQEVLNMPVDSTSTDKVKEQVKSIAFDSLNNQKFIKENEYIGDIKELEQLREIPKDSLGGYVREGLSERGEQFLKNTDEYKEFTGMEDGEGLAALEEYKDQLEQTRQELQEAIAKDGLKQKLASEGKKFATEHMGQIQQVQEQMGKLKQKYNSVANSEDLESAVKRTSLEGEPAWKRLVLGGNFNVTKTNPLNIDFSPVIGYRFNKLFEVGMTAAYRTQFKTNKYTVTQGKEEVLGFSAYASHMVFKNFFGYMESERMNKSGSLLELSYSNWHQTLLLGIGKRFHLTSWLDMQSMIVVNVLHDNKDGLYNSPVIFKTGFRKRN